MTLNKFTLGGVDYAIIDVKEVSIPDSFVKTNKLLETEGHGEARLYVGSVKNSWDVFFNGFYNATGVLCKSHLLKYLDDVKFEYQAQSQKYRKDISGFWLENVNIVNKLEELEHFKIEQANGVKDKARFYIRSQDEIYDIFRKIILPIITNLSIVKLEDENKNIIFLFRPFLEYDESSQNQINFTQEEEGIKNREDITEKEKYTIIKARNGQGKWRESLIDEFSCCIITKVNDERLLIASHIKPWIASNDKEKIDRNNGLLLTPTFDKLFDRGFISFLPNSSILISPYLSPYNISKLKIPTKCDFIFNAKRLHYLEYHLENIFKKG